MSDPANEDTMILWNMAAYQSTTYL